MQVPTRKPGKYANLKPDPYITKEKFNELKNKLDGLKSSRPRAIAEVKRLAADGDFSENAAYQIAKGRLRGLNQRVLEIEEHLRRAVLIKPQGASDRVKLGRRVTVETAGRQKTYLILGSSETDPAAGVISHLSPLGGALLGHKAGEYVNVKLEGKSLMYKIIKIE